MSASVFLYGVLPLVVFVIIDSVAGIRTALVLAFGVSVGEALFIYQRTGEWDEISIIAAVLIALLGGASAMTNNRKYFKLQPVVLSLLMAVFLGYFQLSSQPLVYRYHDLLVQAAPAWFEEYLDMPGFLVTLNFFVNWMVGLFIINAAIIAYAALYCSTLTWLIARGLGFWLLVGVMLLLMFGYMYFWLGPEAGATSFAPDPHNVFSQIVAPRTYV